MTREQTQQQITELRSFCDDSQWPSERRRWTMLCDILAAQQSQLDRLTPAEQPARAQGGEFKVGDRVLTVGGSRGRVIDIDTKDRAYPILVKRDDGGCSSFRANELRLLPAGREEGLGISESDVREAAKLTEQIADDAQELIDAADEAYELPSGRNLKEPQPAPTAGAGEGKVLSSEMYVSPDCAGCKRPLTIDNAWMTDGCPCNHPAGINDANLTRWHLLHDLQQRQSHELSALKADRPAPDLAAKFAEFKSLVHGALDEIGVPSFADQGCRIKPRLEWLKANHPDLAALRAAVDAEREAVDEYIESMAPHGFTETMTAKRNTCIARRAEVERVLGK
jgi:hypothetical protein